MKTGSAASSPMTQWMSPTLDPKALDERIEQLKTVQFWLEQNTRMLQASIQALEVQRMTLATLESMNVPVSQWAQAFSASPGSAAAPQSASSASSAAKGTGTAVDPMQWWSALTQQFNSLASQALATSRTAASASPRTSAKRNQATSSARPSKRRSPTSRQE